MDLNQLYFDHQLSLMRAAAAPDCRIRAAQEHNALTIARKIERHLRALGARALYGWERPYRSADQPA
jgi:hypothetical protein